VFDAAGAVLFEHRFGFPLLSDVDLGVPPPRWWAPMRALIADVDGDGRSEVLVNANAAGAAHRKLYCFEADGRLRFVHQPTGSRRFGDDEYGEPWLAHRTFATRGEDGRRRLWAVFTHNLLFPAVLRELDPRDGAVRQEYWSNGYIEVVQEATWAGRRVLLVGGTNNDFRAASLAVFPVGRRRGLDAGGPAGLRLPRLRGGRPRGALPLPDPVRGPTERAGRAPRRVGGERRPAAGDRRTAARPRGGGAPRDLLHARPGRDAGERRDLAGAPGLHARLEREGSLDHPFGPRDDADMFPVTRWDGRRFVDLPPVRVAH
jgi:hypothetical protein